MTLSRMLKAALRLLNSCQSGREQLQLNRKLGRKKDVSSLDEMRGWIDRIGYQPRDFDRLKIIHIAGTKGKGSTCGLVDSLLRHARATYGRPSCVGLFTSPHLLSVRERIRINSEPISEQMFAKYFFEVWNQLERAALTLGRDSAGRLTYFRMLTLLSFHVFMREGIDTAIYEVGVGGEWDSTNIIEKPLATGITSLGLDHVISLGETIEQIAWHKAGIFKKGVPAFSVHQPLSAKEVLEKRATEKSVSLQWVEPGPSMEDIALSPAGEHQAQNASLATALAAEALKAFNIDLHHPGTSRFYITACATTRGPSSHQVHETPQNASRSTTRDLESIVAPPQLIRDALESTVVSGRCEVLQVGTKTYYLDGAHTEDSLRIVGRWFASSTSDSHAHRFLIFNQQSQRDAARLLSFLYDELAKKGLSVNCAVFCTDKISAHRETALDLVNRNADTEALRTLSLQIQLANTWRRMANASALAVPTIEDAVHQIERLGDPSVNSNILVTGSFHLVGGLLTLLEDEDHSQTAC